MFVNVIFDNDDFLKRIAEKLFDDSIFAKIMMKLQKQIRKIEKKDEKSKTKYQSYKLNSKTDLFYLKNKSNFDKLCISKKCQKEFLQYDHDQHIYKNIHRIHELLHQSIFMFKIKKLITNYVINCFICQSFKFFRQLLYEKLQSISFFSKLFAKFNFDFITILSIIF